MRKNTQIGQKNGFAKGSINKHNSNPFIGLLWIIK